MVEAGLGEATAASAAVAESGGEEANPQTERNRDSDLNSQRASAGSSTLNTRHSRSQTAESSHSIGHNLRVLGEITTPTPVPAGFYSQATLWRSESLDDVGYTRTPHPSWPLPESMLTASAPVSAHGHAHTRSISNSGRRRSNSLRTRTSYERTRTSHERLRTSAERLRTSHERSRNAEYVLPSSLENLDEITVPLPVEEQNTEPALEHAATMGTPTIGPPNIESDRTHSLVNERKSSRKAPTITRTTSNLRDVKPRSRAESSRSEEARKSQQAFLSPRGSVKRGPGSRSRDSDATALPRFLFSQGNLEEQLAAARLMQNNSPSLSLASATREGASGLATEIYTISYLILFSILGTLARLGIQWLTFYPGAPMFTATLWANFAGSFLLGLLSEDRRLFRQEWGSHSPQSPSFEPIPRNASTDKFNFHNRRGHRDEDLPSQVVSHQRVKQTIPMYIGLATGFCASLTSFSTFMRDAFLALSNNLPSPINHPYPSGFVIPATSSTIHRNGGYSFMAIVAVVLLTLCLCLGALKGGAHIATALDPWTPTIPYHFTRRFVDPIIVLLTWGTWIGTIIMTIWPPDRPSGPQSRGSWDNETWRGQVLFAACFAPVGCLIRYYVLLHLNSVSANFPLGTFAVNIFGTAVEGMAFDLQHVSIGSTLVGGGRVPCQVLQGVMDGFCGSLTTVSTWVLELNTLKKVHAYVYGASSVVGGLSLMVAIMGSVRWSVGWSEPVCVTAW